ncbi:MazG nucleotide pyrophosphohydrolase domain-containing protein [Candidatus Nanohalococcus occultus]|uniref:Nucleotide pyrophosphohydrolase n=1 Tax=Candidatus Nanohalococcus occultus TaxID=2978047 RepID=A0ABY8CFN1_9ARCH|nr:Nucleotide pyrophosphohydrolase [Candidatus Nanohaloarchaeota archaeon SVXNc]
MRDAQRRVEEFVRENQLRGKTAFRILDLAAEIGEIAGDAAKSAGYGVKEDEIEVKEDEIGDALFSLLRVASDLGIDAEEALEKSLAKYKSRIEEKGDPGSK